MGCHRAPCMNEEGSKTSRPAIRTAEEDAMVASNSAKYVARLMRMSRRVAPLKSGKVSGLEPNLGIVVNRVNAQARRCHGAQAWRVKEGPLLAKPRARNRDTRCGAMKSEPGMGPGQ